jgi:hypothetical protein
MTMTPDLLDALRAGRPPIPLTEMEANLQARRLRERHGMTYPQLAIVMAAYHGQYLAASGWRTRLRSDGVNPMLSSNGEPRGFARKAVAA